MARTCPFCDAAADSAEHVNPKWLSRRYTDPKPRGTFTLTFGEMYPPRTTRNLNQTVKVCAGCNNGWMAALEARAKTGLVLLAEGNRVEIGSDGQRALAMWFLKNAVVHEAMLPSSSPARVSTQTQREVIASGSVPAGWRVSLGAFEGEGPTFEHHFGVVKQLSTGFDAPGRVMLHTTRLECLIAQVLVHSLADPPDVAELLGGPRFAVEIPQPESVMWPPAEALNPDWLAIVRDFPPSEGEAT